MLTMRKVVLTGVLAALAGGQAWAVTPIASCGFTISAPGNYVVTADLKCAGTAITINASNVSVNLNRHIITSVAGVPGDGISVSPLLPPAPPRLNHVGISGPGLIRGFSGGIQMFDSDYVQVSLTTLAGNTFAGLYASGVNYLTLDGNVIAENGGFGGVLLVNSSSDQVTGNQVVGNTTGIWLGSGDSDVLTGNVANGNSGSGIVMGVSGSAYPLTNSRVSSNTTNGNSTSGIQVVTLVAGSSGNEIFSNLSSVGNKNFDLEDDNPACGTDFWSGNSFFTKSPVACVN